MTLARGKAIGDAPAATKPTHLARAPMRRSEAGAACRQILLVEDDETLAMLITYNLQAHGHSVDWLARGDLVDRYIAGRTVDLVVLDWMLPGRSGLDICRCLRARADTRSIPIIMTTALRAKGDQAAGLGAGVDDYITKPFAIADLVGRIDALLRVNE